ncbi:MAG: hypothetical protein ABW168_14935 [Sedimenticola sp.]
MSMRVVRKVVQILEKASETKSLNAVKDTVEGIGERINEKIENKSLKVVFSNVDRNFGYRPTHNHPLLIRYADTKHQLVRNTVYAFSRREDKAKKIEYLHAHDSNDAMRRHILGGTRRNIGEAYQVIGGDIYETFYEEAYFDKECILDSFSQFQSCLINNNDCTNHRFYSGTVRVLTEQPTDIVVDRTDQKIIVVDGTDPRYTSKKLRDSSFYRPTVQLGFKNIEVGREESLPFQRRGYEILQEVLSKKGEIEFELVRLGDFVDTINFPYNHLLIASCGKDATGMVSYYFVFHAYV